MGVRTWGLTGLFTVPLPGRQAKRCREGRKPTDSAFIESLNGKFRAECLSAHWFLGLADARRKCERWRRDYNEVRPHSAIGYQTPSALARRSPATSPT